MRGLLSFYYLSHFIRPGAWASDISAVRQLKPKETKVPTKKEKKKGQGKSSKQSKGSEQPEYGIVSMFVNPYPRDPLLVEVERKDGLIASLYGEKNEDGEIIAFLNATIRNEEGTQFGSVEYDYLLRPTTIMSLDGSLFRFIYEDSEGKVTIMYTSADGEEDIIQTFDMDQLPEDQNGGKRHLQAGHEWRSAAKVWETPTRSAMIWDKRCGEYSSYQSDVITKNYLMQIVLRGKWGWEKEKYYSIMANAEGAYASHFPVDTYSEYNAVEAHFKAVCGPTATILATMCTVTGNFDSPAFYLYCLKMVNPMAAGVCTAAVTTGFVACNTFLGTPEIGQTSFAQSFAEYYCSRPEEPYIAKEVKVCLKHKFRNGACEKLSSFDPKKELSVLFELENSTPGLDWVKVEPKDPKPGESYAIKVKYSCVEDGVTIVAEGSDKYIGNVVCTQKPNGECILEVPGAEEGVTDKITITYHKGWIFDKKKVIKVVF
ncbi:hypothetical protein IV203_023354 [Nitzschia inconspicua]|uniref:Uncharacterized protein n=1 Tax=Nitzschia inconspicua TaxID=303405 RepID=A0A9K3KCW8_9STRA|nr:hypothetical protein IV203_023354 [Nitzschia inconspicua]